MRIQTNTAAVIAYIVRWWNNINNDDISKQESDCHLLESSGGPVAIASKLQENGHIQQYHIRTYTLEAS